ncbi:MAG: hypothetical protein ACKO5I_04700 [Ignavibacteria bacterium]
MKELNYRQISNIIIRTVEQKNYVDDQIQGLIDELTASCEATLYLIENSSALSQSEKDKLSEKVERLTSEY